MEYLGILWPGPPRGGIAFFGARFINVDENYLVFPDRAIARDIKLWGASFQFTEWWAWLLGVVFIDLLTCFCQAKINVLEFCIVTYLSKTAPMSI